MDYQKALISQVFQVNQSDNISNSPTNISSDQKAETSNSTFIATHSKEHPTSTINAIKVHRNNYIETGINALKIGFPTVYGLLDESDFRRLATEYLKAYPKTCFDWADYGEHLSMFMYDIDALSGQPFLPEIAELDWQLLHIERANDREFDAESFSLMQSHDLTSLIFIPAPGLLVNQALFPLVELYELVHVYNQPQNKMNATVQEEKKLHLNKINNLINNAIKTGVYRSIVLWREQYKGLFSYCDKQAHDAFVGIQKGDTIADVFSYFNEDETALTNWLQQSIETQKIMGINLLSK